MTALLTRLRIAGFKSFAEPVALDILPGLTGIVGPNGCGKSNVVEALRWAMGESSARSLRGGEMDDVIFAGTTARSSRNLAEVSITLQRSADGPLPDPFGDEQELQVTRRIERGAGSQYRANGRELRARDVQTLFADMASGAKSSAMVSQGRVSALVNARPEERRQVLEEAAGITGLHARRHEAELKLRAAEANLARAEELRAQLETGREGLRKQAKQAARYRNISGLVRGAEADFLAVLHARAALAAAAAESAQSQALAAAEAADLAACSAAAELEAADAGLEAPRVAEAEARSLLERRRLAAESLSQDAARAERALADEAARLADIESDLAAALVAVTDAADAVARLDGEAAAAKAQLDRLPAEAQAAAGAATEAADSVRQAESHAESASAQAAEAAAASRQAAVTREQAQRRVDEASASLDQARLVWQAAHAALIPPGAIAAAALASDQARADARAAREAVLVAERQRDAQAARALEAKAVLDRAQDRAAQARARIGAAAGRLSRLDEARASMMREVQGATAARVLPAGLVAARAAAEATAAAARAAEQAVDEAERASTEAGAKHLRALAARDQDRAARASLHASKQDASARLARIDADVAALDHALGEAEAAQPDPLVLSALQDALARAEAQVASAGTALATCTRARIEAGQNLAKARAAASAAAADLARLLAEVDGLRQALGGQDGPDSAPLLDQIDVPAGLEAAFGAVFADAPAALEQPGRDAGRFWRILPPMAADAPVPGCRAMAGLVEAPAHLSRVLAHVAVLGAGLDGDHVQPSLAPGWALVSAAGDVWSWDGQVRRAGAPNAAAVRLQLRARLRALSSGVDAVARQDREALDAAAAREADAAVRGAEEEAARAALTAAEAAEAASRRHFTAAQADAEAVQARLESLRPGRARAAADVREAAAALETAEAAWQALPAAGESEALLAAAIAGADAAAAALQHAREAREAARRLHAQDDAAWRLLEARSSRAESQIAALTPQAERLAEERDEAAQAHAVCLSETAGLPDSGVLEREAAAATMHDQAAHAAFAEAQAAAAAADAAEKAAASAYDRLDRDRAEAALRFSAAEAVLASADAACARENAALLSDLDAAAALPDAVALAANATALRAAVTVARDKAAALAERHAALTAMLDAARSRLPVLAADCAAWRTRHEEACRRQTALLSRAEASRTAHAALEDAPRGLARRAADSSDALAAAEADHAAAAAALKAAEDALRDATRARRDADAALAACREVLARGEGGVEAARAALQAVLARAAERLGPDAALPEVAALEEGQGVVPSGAPSEAHEERARRKLERLQRERDDMGPVNLRADLELDEVDARIAAIETDREELATAIARLRGGIGHLNREGRQRLAAVFTEVDTHFRTLFTRMMGGGRAHLALTGSDDPLEAGLEIFAEPPGKKLSALSLLSGGEQALTALSLIFAVFRCTPAPVAVLDEVDAPLDDVNVDRFCGLLEDVVRDTGTRFLVVTHHQLTMSRMDRLFGVTMQERGVSRLLSVDLSRAAEMVQPAMQAAE